MSMDSTESRSSQPTPAVTLEGPMSAEELLGGGELTAGVLADSCRYAVSQTGKQLRLRLVVEASRLGVCEHPGVLTAARAVELLHVATLAHDDVIDDSPLRRGDASLDSKHGGLAAGYAGAWLFGTAVELATECGEEAVELLAGAACELCDGEMLETQDLHNTARSQERYLAAIAGKTASLFSLAARLGGLAGGAPPEVCTELGRYGHLLGMAFQLADDLLDFFAGGIAGKQCGGDLRHGVFTLAVIYAIEVDATLHEALKAEFDPDGLAELVGRLRATGAFARAAAVCEEYGDAARAVARELQAPSLEAFADLALTPLGEAYGG
jgi:heptaprenyl diphosphate synthase